MNKKIMFLSNLFFLWQFLTVFSQQTLVIQQKAIQPLTIEETNTYQDLKSKFYGNELTIDDNNERNKSILKKRAAFLSQQIKLHAPNDASILLSMAHSLVPSLLLWKILGDPNSQYFHLPYWLTLSLGSYLMKKIYNYSPKQTMNIKDWLNELRVINNINDTLEKMDSTK
jgi:hypothetical protein